MTAETPDERDRPRRRPDPPASAATAAELFDRVATDVGILLSTQIDLAKLELRDEAIRVGRAGRLVGVGLITAAIAALMLSTAAAMGLADLLGAAIGFAIVAVVDGVVALGALLAGGPVRHADPVHDRPVAVVEDRRRWATERTR